MITLVIHKDNAHHYKHIDDGYTEPYYPEPQGNQGDDWVELTIDDEESTDFYYLANTYHISLNHIIGVGYEDENEEFAYNLK
jgi:hypothetical protein